MTTAGGRLVALSGLGSSTASVHWQAIGAGSTAGDRLVAYSGLGTGTAAVHLMTDVAGNFDYIVWARRHGRR